MGRAIIIQTLNGVSKYNHTVEIDNFAGLDPRLGGRGRDQPRRPIFAPSFALEQMSAWVKIWITIIKKIAPVSNSECIYHHVDDDSG